MIYPVRTIAELEDAATACPENAAASASLAVALRRLERHEESLLSSKRAVTLAPGNTSYRMLEAEALGALGRHGEAARTLEEGLALAPACANICVSLATIYLRELGRVADSETLYLRAIQLCPDELDAYVGLCRSNVESRSAPEAAARVLSLVGEAPGLSLVYSALGDVLRENGRYFEAQSYWLKALQRSPGDPTALRGLGYVEIVCGQQERATGYFERAFSKSPGVTTFISYLLHLLRIGELSRAQSLLRDPMRLRLVQGQLASACVAPEWDGSDLRGKTIFVEIPGGFGDGVMFSRFGELFKQRGARVVIECHERLLELLRSVPGIDEVVPPYSNCSLVDVRCRADVACLLLDWTWEDMAAGDCYLQLPQRPSTRLRDFPVSNADLCVGINWRGKSLWAGDPFRFRSAPLDSFKPLCEMPGVRTFALQQGSGREEISDRVDAFPLTDLGGAPDFIETAAVIRAMDLIITVDTVVAHLAGALGKKCWLILPRLSDWRWGTHPTQTPFYRTIKLYRQMDAGNWSEVFSRMAADLKQLVNETATPPSTPHRNVQWFT